jgi:hypothetical protein
VSSKVEGRTVAEDSLQAAVAGGEPSSGSPRQRLLKALLSRPLAFPSGRGLDTRLHVFAGRAFATSCYAIVVVAVDLVASERRVVVALAAGGSLVLGLGFADRLRSDSERWANATRSQQTFVAALKQTLPRPAAGSTIFSSDIPAGKYAGFRSSPITGMRTVF